MQSERDVYRHSDSLVARDLAGEKVILPVRGKVGDLGCIYTLNGTANEIWNLVDGNRSVADIIEMMVHRYEVDRETLAADVHRTIDELRGQALLVTEAAVGGRG
jgi:Coenzyme PQQ synthesis protein D (PqqD)